MMIDQIDREFGEARLQPVAVLVADRLRQRQQNKQVCHEERIGAAPGDVMEWVADALYLLVRRPDTPVAERGRLG